MTKRVPQRGGTDKKMSMTVYEKCCLAAAYTSRPTTRQVVGAGGADPGS